MFREGDVWICMEVMDTSVDKFYARAFKNNRVMPETMLVQIAFSVVSALHYLHTKLKVIHRDVKPSNILVSVSGKVKMCDFGISGYLVDSVAKETIKIFNKVLFPSNLNREYILWTNYLHPSTPSLIKYTLPPLPPNIRKNLGFWVK